MGRIIDVKEVAYKLGVDLTEMQLTAIASKTPNDFDVQWVIDSLLLKDKISAKDIQAEIKKAPKPKHQACQCCLNGYISVLDTHTFRAHPQEYKFIVEIPRNLCSCPNCGAKPTQLNVYLCNITTEEAGWTYVLIYDTLIFHSHIHIPPDQFDPADYWNGIQFQPVLTERQLYIMNQIYGNSKGTEPVPEAAQIVQKAVTAVTGQHTIPF